MDKILRFCLMLAPLKLGFTELSWNRWSLYKPQKPVEYAFRRSQNVPVAGPIYQNCQCPPHEECKIDFKLNEAALDQLEIRGLITKEDAQELKANNNIQNPLKKLPRRMRRFNDEITDDECCCPPRSVMMPTIITEKQFKETIERMNNIVAH